MIAKADSYVDLWAVTWKQDGEWRYIGFKYRWMADEFMDDIRSDNYPYKQPVKNTHIRIHQINRKIYSDETRKLLRQEGL